MDAAIAVGQPPSRWMMDPASGNPDLDAIAYRQGRPDALPIEWVGAATKVARTVRARVITVNGARRSRVAPSSSGHSRRAAG